MSDPHVIELRGRVDGARIATELAPADLFTEVFHGGRIAIVKGVFDQRLAQELRAAVLEWAAETPAADADQWTSNYHRRRAMASRREQWPHVFHDYNFNDPAAVSGRVRGALMSLFEPLLHFYGELTGHEVAFGVPANGGPYVHPQLIQYPRGGGFFARHWHELEPQRVGFIVSLASAGADYSTGGTVFEIDGEQVDITDRHELGDICVWRFDHHHWVAQSDLADPFSWDDPGGRWVATLPFYDPHGWD